MSNCTFNLFSGRFVTIDQEILLSWLYVWLILWSWSVEQLPKVFCPSIELLVYSCQDRTRSMTVLNDVTSWPNLVQCQPPDGSRLASRFLVGTDAIILFLITHEKICYYKLLVYKLFLQGAYSDTQVSLRFKTNI